MDPVRDRITRLAAFHFRRAVMLLVEGEEYMQHQHLLELIPLPHQVAFLELLGAGTGLRDCFGHLEAFLVWKEKTMPLLQQQGILLSSIAPQIALYLLDKQFRAGGLSANLPGSAWC